MVEVAVPWLKNCQQTRTIETGIQIMSQSPAKKDEPHDSCDAGCDTTQIAGRTQITRWLMQREASSRDSSDYWSAHTR